MFGPSVKSENIPGTPMEVMDSLLVTGVNGNSSTPNSSIVNDITDASVSEQQDEVQHQLQLKQNVIAHMTRRFSDQTKTGRKSSDTSNSNNVGNNFRRESIASTDGSLDKHRNSNSRSQEQEVGKKNSDFKRASSFLVIQTGTGPRIVNVP